MPHLRRRGESPGQSAATAVLGARDGPGRAEVALQNQASLPNKDFVLRYRTATERINDAFLIHTDRRGTFFTMVLQPPARQFDIPRVKINPDHFPAWSHAVQ